MIYVEFVYIKSNRRYYGVWTWMYHKSFIVKYFTVLRLNDAGRSKGENLLLKEWITRVLLSVKVDAYLAILTVIATDQEFLAETFNLWILSRKCRGFKSTEGRQSCSGHTISWCSKSLSGRSKTTALCTPGYNT